MSPYNFARCPPDECWCVTESSIGSIPDYPWTYRPTARLSPRRRRPPTQCWCNNRPQPQSVFPCSTWRLREPVNVELEAAALCRAAEDRGPWRASWVTRRWPRFRLHVRSRGVVLIGKVVVVAGGRVPSSDYVAPSGQTLPRAPTGRILAAAWGVGLGGTCREPESGRNYAAREQTPGDDPRESVRGCHGGSFGSAIQGARR